MYKILTSQSVLPRLMARALRLAVVVSFGEKSFLRLLESDSSVSPQTPTLWLACSVRWPGRR